MTVTITALSDAAEAARHAVDLRRQAVRHVWHHATQVAEYADVGPLMLAEGHGAIVRDVNGREYIDGTSILGVTQIGHGRKEMADAIAAQVVRLEYGSLANGFSNVPATLLARKLAEITPGDLEVAFFCCSGSEAVEAALKMARQYQAQRGFKGRIKILGRHGSYHGVTMGALSATGLTGLRGPFEPLVPGFAHVAQPYCYRCELGRTYPDCGVQCADTLEQQILFEGPESVAAFIGEPVAVPQAIKVPPPEYWPRIREICDRYGVLLIVDEVFCGFGRTGRMFAGEHWGVAPDIMTVSKGLTSGYIPLSAAIASRRVAEAFWGSAKDAFQHAGTYSGHPVACVAGLTNIDILEREALPARAADLGGYLLKGLRELADRPFVGNVSGIGLLTSVELVVDRRSRQPASPEVGRFLRDRMAELGLLARYLPNAIYVYPPLVIQREQVDRLLGIFRLALDEAARRFGANSEAGV